MCFTNSFGLGGNDFWLLKLNGYGDIVWEKTYGGSELEEGYSLGQTSGGGYIISGMTTTFGAGDYESWVLKVDSDGNIADCDEISTSNVVVNTDSNQGLDTALEVQVHNASVVSTNAIPQDSLADISTICSEVGIVEDDDEDGVPDNQDNCPNHPNGPSLGTCIHGTIGTTCTINEECDIAGGDGFCSMNQEDNYPLGGNNIGDACDCEGDFTGDGDVDGEDITKFLEDFGRGQYSNPCP